MSLEVGSRLGHYDVTALIGEGGMGQVYQATDTKLNRQVALKILPEAFASDPDRLARFQREAQVLASLNHPGIAAIYGIEESDDTRALVLELVEGPTLADRIAQGSIPVDEALPIAKQIAEALEAAHEAGVIHRDLKPANIKVREDGTVKVLDFGLAKALDTTPAGDPSHSPTVTAAATQMGVILGTAAYMSPEQAKGRIVDKRADVWAFGAVLFEMLTGSKPFSGDDVSTTLARVIEREPDWKALPSSLPPVLATCLRHCLAKDTKQRMRDIGDVRLAMEGAFEANVSAASTPSILPSLQIWQRPSTIATIAVSALVLGGFVVWGITGPTPPPVVRLALPLPAGQTFSNLGRHVLAISPAHDYVAFTADRRLWLRSMDEMEATPVSGSEDAREPFFSPDGQWLGFEAAGQLKRVSVSGGAAVVLADVSFPYGASWGADDGILYGQLGGIWRVPGTGGSPELVIPIEGDELMSCPQLLPGGDLVLFTQLPGGIGSWDTAQIVVQSLATGERTVLIEGGRDARYLSTGHLVYALDARLLAQAFDLDRLAMRGGPVVLVEGVRGAQPIGGAQASVSRDGTLIFVGGGSNGGDERTLVWAGLDGQEEVAFVPQAGYSQPRIAPDGTRVVQEMTGTETFDIWLTELTRGTLSLVTSDRALDFSPIWTQDGQEVVFASNRSEEGDWGFYSKSAGGTGELEHLVTVEGTLGLEAGDWSPDGSLLVFTWRETLNDSNIATLSVTDGAWEPLLDSPANEFSPTLSPDGQWIAYVSDETGRQQIYVQRFPDLGQRQQISRDGGLDPLWSPDGEALYFLGTSGDGPDDMRVVSFDSGPPLSVGSPEVLFSHANYVRPVGPGRHHDIAPDGQRFLMVAASGEMGDQPQQINVVLNWFQELTERVPVP